MKFLLFLVVSVFFSTIGQAQQTLDSSKRLIIEDFKKGDRYVAEDGLTLMSINNTNPKKQDSIRFHSIVSCSFDFKYAKESIDSLPYEMIVFGKVFTVIERGKFRTVYDTDEIDSKIHTMTFIYPQYTQSNMLEKVEIQSKNVRSGEEVTSYVYRFTEMRKR